MAQLGKRKVNHITYFLKQHFFCIAVENEDLETINKIIDLNDKQRLRRAEKIFKK